MYKIKYKEGLALPASSSWVSSLKFVVDTFWWLLEAMITLPFRQDLRFQASAFKVHPCWNDVNRAAEGCDLW